MPLGSVKSVTSSYTIKPGTQLNHHSFDVIIDSGCTKHMVCFRELFFSYKPCFQSLFILADKSKVPYLGIGCVSMILGDKKVMFHDVLHVLSLWCSLLSVWCYQWFKGCSFLGDNSGCFLSFPTFFLPVDDSSDCIIRGKFLPDNNVIDFDSHLVGSVLAVSDNTHFRNSRHSTSLSSSTQKKNIRFCLDSYDN